MAERGIVEDAHTWGLGVGAWLGSFPENLLFWVPCLALVVVIVLLASPHGGVRRGRRSG